MDGVWRYRFWLAVFFIGGYLLFAFVMEGLFGANGLRFVNLTPSTIEIECVYRSQGVENVAWTKTLPAGERDGYRFSTGTPGVVHVTIRRDGGATLKKTVGPFEDPGYGDYSVFVREDGLEVRL